MSDPLVAGNYTALYTRYFHPDRGWTQDDQDAQLRLQSRVELDVQSLIEVRLQSPTAEGTWEDLTEPYDDPERMGRICYAHPMRMAGQDRIAFFAPQPMPDSVWKDLPRQGISFDWKDMTGQSMGHPARAGLEWHLPKKEAQQLWKALTQHGWKMQQRLPLLEETYQLADLASKLNERVGRLLEVASTEPAVAALALDWRDQNVREHSQIQAGVRVLVSRQREIEGYWRQAGGEQHDQAERYLKRSAALLALIRRRIADYERLPVKTVPDVIAELALQRAQRGISSRVDEQGLHLGKVNGVEMVLSPDLTLKLKSS